MSHIEMIRDLAKQGKSYKEICELTQSDYRTVKKYIDRDDFNEPMPAQAGRPAKLDFYQEVSSVPGRIVTFSTKIGVLGHWKRDLAISGTG